MQAAIAQHLNIAESTIVRIEEWANVLFVVATKVGARFVSKKVLTESAVMPELTGSAKQVEWATRIREVSLTKIADYAQSRMSKHGDKAVAAMSELLTTMAAGQTQASWWIDNRVVGGKWGEKSYNMVEPYTLYKVAQQNKQIWVEICKKHGLV